MAKLHLLFKASRIPEPATRHDFAEMLIISLLSCLPGGQIYVDMVDYASVNQDFLHGFLRLKHVPPGHDTFSRLFKKVELRPLGKALEAGTIRQILVDGKV